MCEVYSGPAGPSRRRSWTGEDPIWASRSSAGTSSQSSHSRIAFGIQTAPARSPSRAIVPYAAGSAVRTTDAGSTQV
ncbi:hypothetical protein ACWEO1_17095 [Kitasatospora cineracea]